MTEKKFYIYIYISIRRSPSKRFVARRLCVNTRRALKILFWICKGLGKKSIFPSNVVFRPRGAFGRNTNKGKPRNLVQTQSPTRFSIRDERRNVGGVFTLAKSITLRRCSSFVWTYGIVVPPASPYEQRSRAPDGLTAAERMTRRVHMRGRQLNDNRSDRRTRFTRAQYTATS